jgi:hypothetical protein
MSPFLGAIGEEVVEGKIKGGGKSDGNRLRENCGNAQ